MCEQRNMTGGVFSGADSFGATHHRRSLRVPRAARSVDVLEGRALYPLTAASAGPVAAKPALLA